MQLNGKVKRWYFHSLRSRGLENIIAVLELIVRTSEIILREKVIDIFQKTRNADSWICRSVREID